MTIAITHNKVATLPDQPGVEVNKAEWNDTHALAGLGTGVETALGVNVGTAGAVVVNGGALGTPSSGTATNLTGTAAGLTAGTASAVALSGVTGSYTSGGAVYASSTSALAVGALLAANGVVLGGGAGAAPATSSGLTFGGAAAGTGLVVAAGTATTAVNGLNVSQTANAAGVVFQTAVINQTRTASAAGSSILDCQIAGVSAFSVRFDANFPSGGFGMNAANSFFRSSGNGLLLVNGTNGGYSDIQGGSLLANTSFQVGNADTSISRVAANQLIFSGNTTGGGTVTSRAEINKNVTAIANNTATATLTVTVPNGAHSAGGKIVLKGAAGAGGAIGADEFSALVEYDFVVTRTTGVNAVATLSAALLTAITSSVAGGATPTISAALSAISGAVGATNTFTFNVTINALTGASTNHTCFCYATLINDNASGVTIA